MNPGGGNWSNTNNWSPVGSPGPGDTALITSAGTYTVLYDVTNTGNVLLGAGGGANGIQSLGITNNQSASGIEAAIVVTNGGVVNANNDLLYRISALVEDGGVWNSTDCGYGGSPVEVTNAVFVSVDDQFQGPVTLDNGAQYFSTNLFNDTVEPTSIWRINLGAVATIDNGTFLIEGFVTNAGTINIETNGAIQLYNNNDAMTPYVNGELINAPGGLINIYCNDAGIGNLKPGQGGGYELCINQGTIVGYYLNPQILVTGFDNTRGTVINLSSSAMVVGNYESYVGNLAGNYYVTNGGSIQFWGGQVPLGPMPNNFVSVDPSIVLGGPGQYSLYHGNFILTNDIFPNLLLEGGTLALGTNFQGGSITNLTLDGSTLTNTLPVTGVLNDTNSTIVGNLPVANGGVLNAFYTSYLDCPVTVASGGVFNNLGGAVLNPPGSLTIQSGGLATLDSDFVLNAAMTNYGVVTLTNGGQLGLDYSVAQDYLGELVNAPGGVIQIDAGGAGINGTESGCYFLNQGQIVKNFSNSGVNVLLWDFDNSAGTVTNLEGTLEVGSFVGTLAGTFYASNGTTIQIAGGTATNYLVPGTPLVLGGNGQYAFVQGYLDLPNNIVPGLLMRGGTLMLGPAFQGGAITNLALDGILLTNTLPVEGTFDVTNGAIYGTFVVTNGGVLNSYGGPNFHSGITVASGGRFNVIGGPSIQSDGWLSIAAGGTLDLLANLSLYGVLTNYGTIITTNSGISLGSSLAGMINELGANLFIYGNGGVNGGGYLINSGTITKSFSTGQATMDVTSFTNAGAITAQHGNFSLNTVTLLPAGGLNLDLNSASDYGNFTFSGDAALAGALNVATNHYIPDISTVFDVLNYGSFSGSFSSLNLPSGVGGWQTRYAPTVLQIEAGLPHLAPPHLSKTNLVLNGTNGLAGNQYRVLSATNLILPLADWTPLTTNIFVTDGEFSFTNSAATLPEQFFILISP